jgi:methionine-rich copper-binding protein CopC
VPTVEGKTVVLTAALEPGVQYRLFVAPAVVENATNIPLGEPLVSFRTRSTRTIAKAPPTVVLDVENSVFEFASLRMVFSEPLDPSTVEVTLTRLAGGENVAGRLLVQDIHLTFDPDAPLKPEERYRFEVRAKDLGGEALAASAKELFVQRTLFPGDTVLEQQLDLVPPWEGGRQSTLSELAAMPVNSNIVSSQLIGENTLGVLAGGLVARLSDPKALNGPIPMVLARGQRLLLTPMNLRYGGAIASGLTTGGLRLTLISDANGVLSRSPFRPLGQRPDDRRSPAFVDVTMDAMVTSEDGLGNVLSTQTLLGIRLLGTSVVEGDQLLIDQVGALDFSTLGVGTAPGSLALRLRTGKRTPIPSPTPVQLSASYPANGATNIPTDAKLHLNFSDAVELSKATFTLVQGVTPIPLRVQSDGSTVIVTPQTRLADGANLTLTYRKLESLDAMPVVDGTVSFATAAQSMSNANAPLVTSVVPGAPCALVRATASTPGSCAGGEMSDVPYQPFLLPANWAVHVRFSQPMSPSSIALGDACGRGSVRVERIDAAGNCLEPVGGTLFRFDRELRFSPNAPWAQGQAYRFKLVAGNDDTCGPGELCGRAGKPLNTNPLDGVKPGAGGGPDLDIVFKAVAATSDTFQPLESEPFADQNGNGFIEPEEPVDEKNRVALEVVGTSGIVNAVSLNGDDCLPNRTGKQVCSALHAVLPVSVGKVIPSCPVGLDGKPSKAVMPCIQVRVFPNLIVGTSISMDTRAVGIVPISDLPTGMMLQRIREPGEPAYGYILGDDAGAPQFVVNQEIDLDTPDLSILGGAASHDLQSKPLSVTLKGPVSFRPDGRMDVALRNLNDVPLSVTIRALGLTGAINLRIPAGEMRITLAGPLLR